MAKLQLYSNEVVVSDAEREIWRKLTASADIEGYPHTLVFSGTAESLGEQKVDFKVRTHCLGTLDFVCKAHYQYEIPPDTIPHVMQKRIVDCWLAAVTVLLSYRDQVTYTIGEVLKMAGSPYPEKYAQDRTLTGDEFAELSRRVGLEPEPAVEMAFTPCDLLDLLLKRGPIFMVVDLTDSMDRVQNPDPNFGIYHSIIVTGIVDRESSHDSVIKYWDVMNGGFYTSPVDEFLTRFNIPPEKFRPRYLLLPASGDGRPDVEGGVDFGSAPGTCTCEKQNYWQDIKDEHSTPVYLMSADFVYAPSQSIARATVDIHGSIEAMDMEFIGGDWPVEIFME